jgi:hypothetical protein
LRSDYVLKSGGQVWVNELKVSHDDGDDSDLANTALNQAKNKRYGAGYDNPVLLGLSINDKTREIKAWKCEGGPADGPEPIPVPAMAPKPKTPKKSAKNVMENDDGEDDNSGPRMG